MRELETRYGRMVIPDSENDIVSRFLAQYGEWAELEVAFVAGAVPKGAAVADIGAFIGTFALALQRRKPLGSVCFVEANPDIVPVLQENVRRNCHVPFTVVDALVAPEDFRLKHGLRDMHNMGSASFVARPGHSFQVTVPTPNRRMTLGELDSTYGPFDLIKLDTEGMELLILAGEAGIVERENTAFWLECNEHENSLTLAEYLLAHRRTLYYFAYPSFRPGNFNGVDTPIFAFAYEAGLLAAAGDINISSELTKGCILRPIANREDLRVALWHTPRWAPHEWWDLPTEEVVALATHQLHGGDFDSFLIPGLDESPEGGVDGELADGEALSPEGEAARQAHKMPFAEVRERFRRTEQMLRRSNAWAKQAAADRLELLRAERELRVQANAELGVERELRVEAEARLRAERSSRADATQAAADRLALLRTERGLRLEAEKSLSAVTSSTSWRALKRLQAPLMRMPRLRRGLRALAQSGWRALRAARR